MKKKSAKFWPPPPRGPPLRGQDTPETPPETPQERLVWAGRGGEGKLSESDGRDRLWPIPFLGQSIFRQYMFRQSISGSGVWSWPPKGGGPTISRFFSISRRKIRSFRISLWGSSRGFLVVFGSAGAVECSRSEYSGCRVKPRRPRSRRGSHDSPKAQTCTFEGPGLHKHHQNSTIRPPRGKKE